MRINEANIFVFIASIIVGILISLNISFTKQSERVFLSTKQYQDAYAYRNQLLKEMSDLHEQYNLSYNKLVKYERSYRSDADVLTDIAAELQVNQMVAGTGDVEGPGVKITLVDATTDFTTDPFDYINHIIHNWDMTRIINDLRNAGAEAISINGQRVVDQTEVYCDGAFLKVNGVKIAGPFNISAIGNKDVLKNYMLLDENHLKALSDRQIKVSLEEMDHIEITGFQGERVFKFAITKN